MLEVWRKRIMIRAETIILIFVTIIGILIEIYTSDGIWFLGGYLISKCVIELIKDSNEQPA
jgi:hypothetical protein